MFVEAQVEVAITDKGFSSSEEHERKLWLQRSFKGNACYRISAYRPGAGRSFGATVALNTRVLAEPDWQRIESGQEPELMRWFVEAMFEGKGTLKLASEPVLKGF